MAKLRHLAIKTRNPGRLAEFYTTVFDMKVIVRGKNGSVHLSDGLVNLAILSADENSKEPEHPPGLYHFGFQVDDMDEIARRLREIYPEGAPQSRSATYAETRGKDPDGNLFGISVHGWDTEPKSK